ncbi:Fur family transcriptional regulator [Meiothermus granaticius]|uniref:Zinc-specific metallo-regulatory protein n=1 Tax=Meiothermus granaticius NBRC 107808 TaxID=1227551 RepID=A0A399F6E5_9DEIN|nr:transcriptional repressor [Meiothermus granaticius]MCL6525834.1 transcriptional repressor [Thermaceae bacterium]RIH92234.1 Zinc-specific metallo-regulatory protein [Meiothermus granaticius NBRC 107808]GEM85590.1 transcriptional repressor [Meiothermus granaticius NBRC 107808]
MERSTRQRQAIRAVLEEIDRPLSPQEVLSAAQHKVPGLGIATVYRTLKGMVEEGMAVAVELPGNPPRYERSGKKHHHHFHCIACGKAFELEGCPGDFAFMAPRGFQTQGHEIVLYGRCAECCQRNPGATTP